MSNGESLGRRIASGAVWTASETWGGHVLGLAITAILARLLEPRDFGLLAMAAAFIALAEVVVDQGFSRAIIQRKDLEDKHLDSAFWVSLGLGAVFAAATALFAGPLGRMLGDEAAAPILRWLALTFLLGGLTPVQTALLTRRLAFRSLAGRKMAGLLGGGVVGIAMALGGYGVWALVGQQLAGRLVSTAVLWRIGRWRPGFRISLTAVRELGSFGLAILTTRTLRTALTQAPVVVIGRFLGATDLGYYNVAYRVLAVLKLASQAAGNVSFPAFSALQDDAARFKKAFLRVNEATVWLAVPAFAGMIVLAPTLIPTVFGAKWTAAVPIVQILSVAGVLEALTQFSAAAVSAAGHPFRQVLLNLIRLVTISTILLIAVPGGLRWVAIGYVVETFLTFPFGLWQTKRFATDFPVREYLIIFRGPLLAAAVMAGVVMATSGFLLRSLGDVAGLVSSIAVGLVVYTALVRVIVPVRFLEFTRLARSVVRRPQRSGG